MSDAQRSVVCPVCGGKHLYVTVKPIPGGGGYAPDLLPGLHRWFKPGALRAVLCADCGLHRMFAESEARQALRASKKWRRLRAFSDEPRGCGPGPGRGTPRAEP